MQRFDSWDLSQTSNFWTKRFKPKYLLNATSFAHSVISHQWDSYLLEKYDINNLEDHTTGTAYIWIPIFLDKPTYDEDSYPYCYVYDIDENWLYIDAIYDRHVNPEISLQVDIDYSYKQGSGKLKCKKEILNSAGTLPKLYISKGWYAEYRIYNEIGHFLEYLDKDSPKYRDSLGPLLAALYVCPSYYYLLAVLNVMAGLPVAKYDDETVVSIINGIITTDKYVYSIGTVHTHLTTGMVLKKFQPLTDVVELHTDEIEPAWWKNRPVSFFQKYTPGVILTDSLRDYIMENYLMDSVAGVEFRQDKLGINLLDFNYQLQKAFLKAAPSHSDFLFTQSYHVGTSYDVYNVMAPSNSSLGATIRTRSMFGRFTKNIGENGDYGISSTLLPSPKVNDEDKYVEGTSLKFGEGIWHLYNSYDAFNDRWKYLDTLEFSPTYKVFVEPWQDRVYLRQGTTPLFKDTERKYIPDDLPESLKPTVFLELGTPDKDVPTASDMLFSDMTTIASAITEPVEASYATVTEYINYTAQDILNTKFPKQWERVRVTGVSKDSYFYVTVQSDTEDTGYIISPEINLGIIEKAATFTVTYAPLPNGAGITIFYSTQDPYTQVWSDWCEIDNEAKASGLKGKLKVKIVLFQNRFILDGKPKLNNFRLHISSD